MLELIKQLPKTDLHVHLDGSVRLSTLITLAKQQRIALPSFTQEGLIELVFKDNYSDLNDYLRGFQCVLPIMQNPQNLEQISYEFAEDSIADGVYYVEVRFAPDLHINNQQTIDQVLLSINNGLNRAKLAHNQTTAVKHNLLPAFNYGIIACAMRHLPAAKSEALVANCVRIRDRYAIPIVAFDLAGAEASHPPMVHKHAYYLAHKNFLLTTVHAGEGSGIDSIKQAMLELNPERLGHGFHLFDPSTYTDKLVQYLAQKRTTIEVCLSSNKQTMPNLLQLDQHAFKLMLQHGLSTTICTDNRTISKTSASQELMLACKYFNLTANDLKNLIMNGFAASFYPGSYLEKIKYIDKITKFYDSCLPHHCEHDLTIQQA